MARNRWKQFAISPDDAARLTRRHVILGVTSATLVGCSSKREAAQPTIQFTRIPQADQGGRDKHDIIQGSVTGARTGQQLVLYAKSGTWWVQPLVSSPYTRIAPNSTWISATHLGTDYAALLVEPGYRPPETTDVLPQQGGDVVAVAIVKGQASPPSPALQFSGYEWRVRNAPSSRGGAQNIYDPANAWTDAAGALHMRIAKTSDKWTCAELSMVRNLGYGTYSFTVRDISRLEPAAVLSMYTWDYAGVDNNNREMDVEITRFGDPTSKNAQFVVQPTHVPANVARFDAPPGALTHSLQWEPGRVSFKTVRGSKAGPGERAVAEHVFTSGVPTPGIESIRISFYVYGNVKIPLENPAEVVIEKFNYFP